MSGKRVTIVKPNGDLERGRMFEGCGCLFCTRAREQGFSDLLSGEDG